MGSTKSLFKDTAIYGLSSIVGRFLNWCLVPIYTYCFAEAEYGVVTNLYAYVALALILLTYGMETGFFRFSNHERWKDEGQVYSTTLISVGATSTAFILAGCLLSPLLAGWLGVGAHPSYVWMMVVAVGVDAYTSIPFAYLRYRRQPVRFAVLRLVNIGVNIALNLFFILLCPVLWREHPAWVGWFYNPGFGIGYIFLANMISSLVVLLLLAPKVARERWAFCWPLLREMLRYSFPLLILGIAGIMNQTLDKILYPMLVANHEEAMTGLGIYGANYKIAIVMVMFIQAFRFAYEPFIFAQSRNRGEDSRLAYRQAMNWFVIFGLFIFLGVMYFLPVIKYFIAPAYFEGLRVVPIVMMAELMFGVFFNLSVWYKITDRTIWGTYFSLLGLGVTLTLNILFVPRFGYMACAWAALACYGLMMVSSWVVGRLKHPVGYELRRLLFYLVVALGLWGAAIVLRTASLVFDLPLRCLLLAVYLGTVFLVERRGRFKRLLGRVH